MARSVIVVLMVALIGAVLPRHATAAGPTWYRTAADAGVASYRTLATSSSTSSFSTVVEHGGRTGTFRFSPGSTVSTTTSGPGQSPSGVGWATPRTLDGSIAGGTWTFGATVDTSVATGSATGRLMVAVYAVGGAGSQLLAVVQDSRNVLASNGTRTIELAADLPRIDLAGRHLATEWYLVISSNDAASTATTSLRQGTSSDHVTAPNGITPPELTAPTNLQVTGTGDNRISVAWSASTDSRVTGYVVRRATSSSGPWVEVATVGGTSFTDTGLNNGTRYYHTVVARDAGGTRSSPSNATSAVPADTSSPTSPGDPVVVPNGSGRLDVTWPASPSGDVVAYEVQRAGSSTGPFAALARVGGTSFSNTGLPAASTWHYRIVAIDDDGLRSAPTSSSAGTVAPSPPSGLRVAGVASGAVALAWNGTDEPVIGYVIERATSSGGPFTQVAGPVGGTSFTDGGLVNGTRYWYRIRAVDSAGARSSPSGTVSAVPVDTGRPAPPTFLVKEPLGDRVRFSWGRSPSSGVVGYRVLRSTSPGGPYSDRSGLTNSTSFVDGPLAVAVPYYYVVVAEDAAGNRSIPSTEERYTVPPSAPTNLRARDITETGVTLTWDGTSQPIDGWVVSRRLAGGRYSVVGRTTSPTFQDGGLELGRTYTFIVQAEASDGTLSPPSNEVVVVPRDGPPTAPTGVQVADTGAGGQLRVLWAANPEPDVVTYRVERASGSGGWALIATLGTTSYLDGGLSNGTTYRYRVVAVDRVGNVSAPSAEASGVPSDRTAPPPPSGILVRSWPTYLDVVWSQSLGASGYRVYRATSPSGPYTPVSGVLTNRTFRDTNVTSGTTYYYVVHALDPAGNDSGPSQAAAATFTGTTGVIGGTPGGPGGGGEPTSGPTPGGGTIPGFSSGPVAGGPTEGPTGVPGFGTGLDPDTVGGGDGAGDPGDGPTPLAIGEIPPQAIAPDQPGLPPGSSADDALAQGDLGGTIARSAEEVAENVGQVVRVFRIPLLLLVLLLIYLVAQGRLGREPAPADGDVVVEGGDEDDVEYLL